MIIYACDFCGYIIRGSRIESWGRHFCSTDCHQRFQRGEKFNPNKPAPICNASRRLIENAVLDSRHGIRWNSGVGRKLVIDPSAEVILQPWNS